MSNEDVIRAGGGSPQARHEGCPTCNSPRCRGKEEHTPEELKEPK